MPLSSNKLRGCDVRIGKVACLNPLRKAAAEVQQGLTCSDEFLVGVHAPLLGTT